jgi:hypothetical protein
MDEKWERLKAKGKRKMKDEGHGKMDERMTKNIKAFCRPSS